MDMGCDHEAIYAECEQRGCHPIIPLRETPAVKAGKHRPPVCEHGEWTFAGSDAKRRAAKMALPDRRVLPGEPVDRGQPVAHLGPSGNGPLEEAVSAARRGRAGEWPAQERVGAAAAAGPPHRAGPAARRPDHPGPADNGPREGPSGPAACVAADASPLAHPVAGDTIAHSGPPASPLPRGLGRISPGGPECHPCAPAREVTNSASSSPSAAFTQFRWPYRWTLLGDPGRRSAWRSWRPSTTSRLAGAARRHRRHRRVARGRRRAHDAARAVCVPGPRRDRRGSSTSAPGCVALRSSSCPRGPTGLFPHFGLPGALPDQVASAGRVRGGRGHPGTLGRRRWRSGRSRLG
jgi:hypothetical protein